MRCFVKRFLTGVVWGVSSQMIMLLKGYYHTNLFYKTQIEIAHLIKALADRDTPLASHRVP